jgi:hypothetical protein
MFGGADLSKSWALERFAQSLKDQTRNTIRRFLWPDLAYRKTHFRIKSCKLGAQTPAAGWDQPNPTPAAVAGLEYLVDHSLRGPVS